MKLKEGQVWNYKNNFDSNSYCVITKIENRLEERIIHIQVKNIKFEGETVDIDHMPFALDAFISSVISLIGTAPISEDCISAISIWEKDGGGVWNVSVSEAIDLI